MARLIYFCLLYAIVYFKYGYFTVVKLVNTQKPFNLCWLRDESIAVNRRHYFIITTLYRPIAAVHRPNPFYRCLSVQFPNNAVLRQSAEFISRSVG